ncbi:MAG: M28 family peptidase [Verrucomicrobia bacterium]|nr:M28 family peptidase [Verrucomicrobiota bacterium]
MSKRERRVARLGILVLLVATAPARGDNVWEKFSGANAFAHVQNVVEMGPRPAGSDALEKSRGYIRSELEKSGWRVTSQTFTDKTPRGAMTFVNLVATFGEHPAPSFLLCSHYDTKTFDTVRFVGANDGGSSTGLLIEMGHALASDPALAAKVELVFFDGEEAFEAFTATDGLYGSRHFAEELRASGTTKQFHGGMLFDMVGNKSLDITLPPNSPPELTRAIFAAADALKLRDHFTYFQSDVTDDHTPLNAAGIPVIDLIDFDYPPWHTPEDTLDKISAQSLEIVGRVALYALARLELK